MSNIFIENIHNTKHNNNCHDIDDNTYDNINDNKQFELLHNKYRILTDKTTKNKHNMLLDKKYDETNLRINMSNDDYREYQLEWERVRIIDRIVNKDKSEKIYESELKKLSSDDFEIIRLKKEIKLLKQEKLDMIIEFNRKIDDCLIDNKKEMLKLKRKINSVEN
jgi:hypothetical protein